MTYPLLPFKWLLIRNDGGVWGEEPTGIDDTLVLRSTDQTADGHWKINEPALRRLPAQDALRFRLREEDLLVTKSSGSSSHIGKTTIVTPEVAHLNSCYSNFMQRLRLTRSSNARFYWYALRTREVRDQLALNSTTSTGLANLTGSTLGRVQIAYPPVNIQERVVFYLDREIAQIDELIAKQERLIELLAEKRQAVITQAVTKGLAPSAPTKPSGTPWQGPVPKNWSVQPLKNLVRIQTGVTLGKDYSEAKTESFAYLRVANVQVGRVDLTDVKRIDLPADQAAASLLQKGDVLMTEGGDRDKLARGCIWDAPIAPCVHQNHIFAARTKSTLLNEFLVLVLDAAPARTYFFLTGKQSTNLASTNSTTVKNFRFGVPPRDEQRLIVQEVRSKTDKIDTLTAKARAVISVLQERRSALISAAVTGKIDVREGAA